MSCTSKEPFHYANLGMMLEALTPIYNIHFLCPCAVVCVRCMSHHMCIGALINLKHHT